MNKLILSIAFLSISLANAMTTMDSAPLVKMYVAEEDFFIAATIKDLGRLSTFAMLRRVDLINEMIAENTVKTIYAGTKFVLSETRDGLIKITVYRYVGPGVIRSEGWTYADALNVSKEVRMATSDLENEEDSR